MSDMWLNVPCSPNPVESFSFDLDYSPLFQDKAPISTDSCKFHHSTIVFTVDINRDGISDLADVTFSDIDTLNSDRPTEFLPVDIAEDGVNDKGDKTLSSQDSTSKTSESEGTTIMAGELSEDGDEKVQCLQTIHRFTPRKAFKSDDATSIHMNIEGGCSKEANSQPFHAPPRSLENKGMMTDLSEQTSSLKRKDSRKHRTTGGVFLKSPETGTFMAIGYVGS